MNSIFWQELPESIKNNPDMNLRYHLGTASPETMDNRYSICKACDKFDQSAFTCTECSCNMGVGITRSSAVCPINKW